MEQEMREGGCHRGIPAEVYFRLSASNRAMILPEVREISQSRLLPRKVIDIGGWHEERLMLPITCNRYGLTNEDLNRRWSNPNQVYHPVIYHTKGLMEYCARVLQRPPHVFVDYHGHSRRKNVFLFGCSRSGSWSAADRAKPDQPVQYLMLPHLMQRTSPAFALPLCSFKVERNKESTARVAVWRQLGVSRSYTMESSFCGCDQGTLAGLHLDTGHLKAIGTDFCQAVSMMKDGGDDWDVGKIPMEGHLLDEECSDSESDESDFQT